MSELVTHSALTNLLCYDSNTGVFNWNNVVPCKVKRGDVAGKATNKGYVSIMVNYRAYMAHRLAWFYVHGKWPENQIDHINGNKADNRISNLRDVTASGNQQNVHKAQKHNKLGVLGVSLHRGRPRASITVNNKVIVLGKYETVEEAHQVYLEAKRRLHATCTL